MAALTDMELFDEIADDGVAEPHPLSDDDLPSEDDNDEDDDDDDEFDKTDITHVNLKYFNFCLLMFQ